MGNIIKTQTAERPTNGNTVSSLKEYDNLVVLSDYPCRDVSEPLFRIGERLRGLAQDSCWWRVCSLESGSENYIPSNHVAKVFYGWLFEGVGRQKAEELLLLPGNTFGSFLVRESPYQRGMYSLSVRHRDIKHYKIFRLDNSWYYISPGLTFQCLEDMINHYSDCSDGICCILSAPCLALASSPNSVSQAPPVVMRRNFTWKKVNRSELGMPSDQSTGESKRSMVSYGVRSSIAAYLSVTETEDVKEKRRNTMMKKRRTIYTMSNYNN